MIPPKAVSTADDIYTYALPMMVKLEREIPGMKLRLMGLRCTNLVSTKKRGIDFFGTAELSKAESRTNLSSANNKASIEEERKDGDDNEEWEVWPEGEFEQAARHEREAEMNEIEQLSQELHDQDLESADSPSIRSKHKALDDLNDSRRSPQQQQQQQQQHPPWSCPICNRSQPRDDKTFNAHIDYCLSRQTIKEAASAAARATSAAPLTHSSSGPPGLSSPAPSLGSESKTRDSGSRRGRGRPRKRRKLEEEESEGKKQKQQLLFGR